MFDPVIRLVTKDPHISFREVVCNVARYRQPARVDRRTLRTGGKPAATSLKAKVKPGTKRADFLQWFLDAPQGRTVGATMANFGMSRPNVFTHWTVINREHGIGYRLENNTITVQLPQTCSDSDIFR